MVAFTPHRGAVRKTTSSPRLLDGFVFNDEWRELEHMLMIENKVLLLRPAYTRINVAQGRMTLCVSGLDFLVYITSAWRMLYI